MKKVIKLTESELINMITNVIKEQNETSGDESVKYTLIDQLSEMRRGGSTARRRIGFVKALIHKYIPDNVVISKEELEELWNQTSRRDFDDSDFDKPQM
jgi:hypothetical protein